MVHKILLSIFALVTIITPSLQSSHHFNHDSLIVSNNIQEVLHIVHAKSNVMSEKEYNYIVSLLYNIQKYVNQKAEEDFYNYMTNHSNGCD